MSVEAMLEKLGLFVINPKDITPPTVIPTGLPNFDIAFRGGLPSGVLNLIIGNPAVGKSTFALICAKQVQETFLNGKVLYVDGERSIDANRVSEFRLDSERLIVVKPVEGEPVMDAIIQIIMSEESIRLIVIDSLITLLPTKDIGDMNSSARELGDSVVAEQARLINKFVTRINPSMTKREWAKLPPIWLVAINHVYTNLMVKFGDPDIPSGGRGQIFYAYNVIKIGRPASEDKKDEVGNSIVAAMSFFIKKTKQTVSFPKFTEMVTVVEHSDGKGHFFPGKSKGWNLVLTHLKSFGLNPEKEKGEITFLGEKFKNNIEIERSYYESPGFRKKIHQLLIDSFIPQRPHDEYISRNVEE